MTFQQNIKVLSVSEFTEHVKQVLERAFPFVAIQGEISNFKLQSSGHLYFSLKDAHSQISCVMFRGSASKLKALPKEGDQVQVKGEINVYPPRGSYQLVVRELTPMGVGELLLKFQQLKEKLQRMGWFDKERKRPLPSLPKRIGVITSPTGAVIRDIIHVLERRFGNFHLILNPVKVQGEGAAEEIARAIYECNQYKLCDVLIVGRGGGSFEDLFPFSEEIVAKAIFESQIPIISAVGHETDYSIADFVADVRAPTPSAAAEIALGEKAHLIQQLKKMDEALYHSVVGRLNMLKERFIRYEQHPLLTDPYALLGLKIQQLDEVRNRMDQLMVHKFKIYQTHFSGLQKQLLGYNLKGCVQQYKERLNYISSTLEAIHPKHLLKKGYSILFKGDQVVSSVSQVKQGDVLKAKLYDGELPLSYDKKRTV